MIKIKTPISDEKIKNLNVGDKLLISGEIFTGRDAVLPKLADLLIKKKFDKIPFNIEGIAIMHTGVSDAGIAPTTSNKKEIESNIPILSKKGVKIHIGKGALSKNTVNSLNKEKAIFVVTPPIAALLSNCVKSKKVVAFEEEGMEAIFKLEVENIPGIVVISNGKSTYGST